MMRSQQIYKLFRPLCPRALASAPGLRQRDAAAAGWCGQLRQSWVSTGTGCSRFRERTRCSNTATTQSCPCDGNPLRGLLWSTRWCKGRTPPQKSLNTDCDASRHLSRVHGILSQSIYHDKHQSAPPFLHTANPLTTGKMLRERDHRLPIAGTACMRILADPFSTSITPPSEGGGKPNSPTDNSGNADIDLRRQKINKILYRSKQRGYLELDLVIGKWAEKNAPTMDDETLSHFAALLDEENPDLWKWLTGQDEPSAAIAGNPVFTSIRDDILEKMNARSSPSTRAPFGDPWVRGWDDIKHSSSSFPPAGNQ